MRIALLPSPLPRLAAGVLMVALPLTLAACDALLGPHRRAEIQLRRGDPAGAVLSLTEAIEQGDHLIVAYANRCIAYGFLGRNEEAAADCSRALELIGPDPEGEADRHQRAEILNNRAVAYLSSRKREEAVADLTEAIALSPNYAVAYANRGRAYAEQSMFELAVADLDKALGMNPDLAEAYGNRAYARTGLGDLEEAIADYGRSIAKGGGPTAIYDRARLLYTLGCFGEALEDYRQVANQTQDEYRAWMAETQVNFLASWDGDDEVPEICEAARRPVAFPTQTSGESGDSDTSAIGPDTTAEDDNRP